MLDFTARYDKKEMRPYPGEGGGKEEPDRHANGSHFWPAVLSSDQRIRKAARWLNRNSPDGPAYRIFQGLWRQFQREIVDFDQAFENKLRRARREAQEGRFGEKIDGNFERVNRLDDLDEETRSGLNAAFDIVICLWAANRSHYLRQCTHCRRWFCAVREDQQFDRDKCRRSATANKPGFREGKAKYMRENYYANLDPMSKRQAEELRARLKEFICARPNEFKGPPPKTRLEKARRMRADGSTAYAGVVVTFSGEEPFLARHLKSLSAYLRRRRRIRESDSIKLHGFADDYDFRDWEPRIRHRDQSGE